ncbi:MAG: hypothetical protein A3A65_02155 [Candidatus Chisholmbacteria bacterium RIFCSPLOWO2_01_FULL_49_14]|uniref:Penicillin-binding protein 2 n=1 Tax=Candidatus Chisholmbacteria bacterium RIFCSPLOWO2_01_FULL_49_14 TaxID=1797593 RepID=A0A1G1W238_9BACT|nr:MAG: hypothetical protein A3A65_02155 [Candidatus Chisholmbacteria bacterium RIFCSPLOWO2_01_FULL_49_14]
MNPEPLGLVFSDELLENSGKTTAYFSGTRLRLIWAAFLLCFSLLFLRLVWLQIIQGSRNRVLSDENRILVRRIQAPRGVITDRNGEVLAQNIPIYKMKNPDCTEHLGSQGAEKTEVSGCREYVEISREEALKLEATGGGGDVLTIVGRRYVYGPEIAQVLGFVGEADTQEMAQHPDYDLGDLIGKTGVELEYEEYLHGTNGAELVEIDADAAVVREISKSDPLDGGDLKLTIDASLQKKAYDLIGDRVGALVALDPRNGQVLTLVSRPSFDPNNVSVSLDGEDQPFFNRSIAGIYPPGSVFKVVTATAGLEDGKITAATEIEDTGEIRIGTYRYGNWYFDQYGRKEGSLNIVHAIKRSNDIFFYRVGEAVGATMLSEWAKAFGFGRLSGIDLPGEADGLVPSPLWKEQMRGERWFLGNTYHFAIGQSDLTVTPLQVAQMTGVAATGKLCQPHVAEHPEDKGSLCEDIGIHEETLRLVRAGMAEACLPGGTAFPFFNFGVGTGEGFRRIEVGCKTGTAEFGDPKERTHAWFTAFAPKENPEITVTVLLEGAGEGSYEAAPVAKGFLEEYFANSSR